MKEVIIRLIKDDIKNTQLITGLTGLGISADHYILHTSDVIFELTGVESFYLSEEVYRGYFELIKQHLETAPDVSIDFFAESLYSYLYSFTPETISQ